MTPGQPSSRVLPPALAGVLQDPGVRRLIEAAETDVARARQNEAQLRQTLANERQAAEGKRDERALIWESSNARQRKRALYEVYKRNTILGSVVDAVALRFVSGSWSVAPLKAIAGVTGTVPTGAPAEQMVLAEFFNNCNPFEDLKQILLTVVKQLLIFGESYLETVHKGPLPWELYTTNCMLMDFVRDGYGGVSYYTYGDTDQQSRLKRIDLRGITRIWLPAGDDVQKPFSPLEGMVNTLYADTMMVKTQEKTFENMGSASRVIYELPPNTTADDADLMIAFDEEHYAGALNAGRDRYLYGGTKANAVNLKGLEADFLDGRKRNDIEIMGRLLVPPQMVSVVEQGALGGDAGAAQERSFIQNVLTFYKGQILEKINYHIVNQGFGIYLWLLDIAIASTVVDPLADQTDTVNEKRVERGKAPVEGGDVTFVQLQYRAVVPEYAPGTEPSDPPAKASTSGTTGGGDAATGAADDAPGAGSDATSGAGSIAGGDSGSAGSTKAPKTTTPPKAKKGTKAKAPTEAVLAPAAVTEAVLTEGHTDGHTGAMVGLWLSPAAAAALALPDGEPADRLHLTLCYCGDAADLSAAACDALPAVVSAVAAAFPPLVGRVGGWGLFPAEDASDATDVLYAAVDVPGLSAVREAVASALADAGVPVAGNHGFTPHVTLAYRDPADDTALPSVARGVPLLFDAVTLALGDTRTSYLFTGPAAASTEEA